MEVYLCVITKLNKVINTSNIFKQAKTRPKVLEMGECNIISAKEQLRQMKKNMDKISLNKEQCYWNVTKARTIESLCI